MNRADALRAACVAFLVTAAVLLLSLSGCAVGDHPEAAGAGYVAGTLTTGTLMLLHQLILQRERR